MHLKPREPRHLQGQERVWGFCLLSKSWEASGQREGTSSFQHQMAGNFWCLEMTPPAELFSGRGCFCCRLCVVLGGLPYPPDLCGAGETAQADWWIPDGHETLRTTGKERVKKWQFARPVPHHGPRRTQSTWSSSTSLVLPYSRNINSLWGTKRKKTWASKEKLHLFKKTQ